MKWVLLLWLPLVAGSCGIFETDEFVCTLDNECPGVGGYGKCVVGHCAFMNDACVSGYMYDETAGPVASTCVSPSDLVTDAAPPPADAVPPIDGGLVVVDGSAGVD